MSAEMCHIYVPTYFICVIRHLNLISSGGSGTQYVSEIVTSTTQPLMIYKMCLQSCGKFISWHVSYAFYAFCNIISIITPT